MTATVESPPDIDLPPVVMHVAQQIERGNRFLSPSEAVAAYVCSTGEVGEALRALPAVRALRARHTKVYWDANDTRSPAVCRTCNVGWPCTEASILGVA